MIHIGRFAIDTSQNSMIRKLESFERYQRAKEAEKIALFCLDNRSKYDLSICDLRKLENWIDKIYTLGISVVPGGLVSQGASITPVDIIGSSGIIGWWRTDSGVTTATGISAWAPIFGTAGTFTQATGTTQPAWTANNSSIFGRGSFAGDGVDDILNVTNPFNLPGTAPSWHRFIFNQISNTNGSSLFANGLTVLCVNQATSPQLVQRNNTGGNLNSGAAINTWCRMEVYFSNSINDYLKCASTSVAGTNSGNTGGNGPTFCLCARPTNNYSHVAFAEYLALNILPSTLQRAQLDGLTNLYYNSTISI